MARRLLERDGLEALTLRAAAREAHVSHWRRTAISRTRTICSPPWPRRAFASWPRTWTRWPRAATSRKRRRLCGFRARWPCALPAYVRGGLRRPLGFRVFSRLARSLRAQPANKRNRCAGRQQQGDAGRRNRAMVHRPRARQPCHRRARYASAEGSDRDRASPRYCNCLAEATGPITTSLGGDADATLRSAMAPPSNPIAHWISRRRISCMPFETPARRPPPGARLERGPEPRPQNWA